MNDIDFTLEQRLKRLEGAYGQLTEQLEVVRSQRLTQKDIGWNAVGAQELQVDSVLARHISVTELSAISADLGTVTAGDITLDTAGFIRGGATAYDTGTGFWMGYDTSAYKFFIGNSAGNKLTWDGTNLTITGAVSATSGTIGGFDIGSDYIRDAANSMGLASTVTGGDDVRFWAGAAFASRSSAPFRVTEAGALVASSATITGALTTAASSSINGTYLVALSVPTAAIAAGAITTAKLAALAVTNAELAAGAVTTAKIAALAVTSAELAAGAVTTAKIAALAVTATELASSAVTTAKIAADAVTAAEIAAGAVGSTELAAGAVIAGKITAGTIVAADIAAGTITGAKIAATTITASNIAALTITAAEIAANTITGAKIAANTISASNIVGLTITAAEIAAGTITGAKIAATTITASNIAGLTITAAEIAASTITAGKLNISQLSAISADLGTITAGAISGITIAIGSSNSIFKADASGIYLGNATFGSAPFRVSMAGALVATSATISGTITSSNGTIGGFTLGGTSMTAGSGNGAIRLDSGTGYCSYGTSGNQTSTVSYLGLSVYDGSPSLQRAILQSGGGSGGGTLGIFNSGGTPFFTINYYYPGEVRFNSTSTNLPGYSNTETGVVLESTNGLFLSRGNGTTLFQNRNDDGEMAAYSRGGTQVGSISVTSTNTAFNTSSDIRKKTDLGVFSLKDIAAPLYSLPLRKYRWHAWEESKDDATKSRIAYGVYAQEAKDVCPWLVNKFGDDWYVNWMSMMPNVIAALQSQHARISALESQ